MGFSVPIGKSAADVTFLDALHHMALPAVTLSLVGVANIALHTRAKAIDVLNSPYVRFARARGQSPAYILRAHGLRNLVLPALTLQFASIAEIFGGSVLVEEVFSYPGLGQAAVTAGLGGDVALLAAIALVSAALVFGGNLLANLLYGLIDPRMSFPAAPRRPRRAPSDCARRAHCDSRSYDPSAFDSRDGGPHARDSRNHDSPIRNSWDDGSRACAIDVGSSRPDFPSRSIPMAEIPAHFCQDLDFGAQSKEKPVAAAEIPAYSCQQAGPGTPSPADSMSMAEIPAYFCQSSGEGGENPAFSEFPVANAPDIPSCPPSLTEIGAYSCHRDGSCVQSVAGLAGLSGQNGLTRVKTVSFSEDLVAETAEIPSSMASLPGLAGLSGQREKASSEDGKREDAAASLGGGACGAAASGLEGGARGDAAGGLGDDTRRETSAGFRDGESVPLLQAPAVRRCRAAARRWWGAWQPHWPWWP